MMSYLIFFKNFIYLLIQHTPLTYTIYITLTMMSYLCQKCRNIGDQQDLFSDKACEKTTLILKIGARYTAWLQSLISVSSDGVVTSFVTSLSSEDS